MCWYRAAAAAAVAVAAAAAAAGSGGSSVCGQLRGCGCPGLASLVGSVSGGGADLVALAARQGTRVAARAAAGKAASASTAMPQRLAHCAAAAATVAVALEARLQRAADCDTDRHQQRLLVYMFNAARQVAQEAGALGWSRCSVQIFGTTK